MDSVSFEKRMRAYEYYHTLRLLPGTWTVIRVDGRAFSRFTEDRFVKPFDVRFRDLMSSTAEALMVELHGVYAYTESDEISLLFPPAWDMFDREVEKTVSVSASIAGAAFTLAAGEAAHFDSRIWVGVNEELVIDYFWWRQADAARCALNSWAYWTLRESGKSIAEATSALRGQTVAYKNELLFQHGINFNELPLWQRRGTGLYWESYEKAGFDPVRKQKRSSPRRRIKVDQELPMKGEYDEFLSRLLQSTTK